MTVWNMRTAVVLWGFLAFFLFLVIFFFHPKSYSGLLPFRTVSVVAQTTGPVTEINVQNGQRVAAGDLLFRIEDSAQRAAVRQAETEFDKLAAEESNAQEMLAVSRASVVEVMATLEKLRVDLENAQVALDKTQVRSFTSGVVTQLAMSEGSPASTLILSPAMVIIPDRPERLPVRITAGFSQVARSTIYEDMPAEIACDSNFGLSFRDAILPARVASVQPAVAAGQVVPRGRLLEPNNGVLRGSLRVYFELEHPEHAQIMLDGRGCIVQTYTNNLHGLAGHIIAATGVVKAAGLRLKV